MFQELFIFGLNFKNSLSLFIETHYNGGSEKLSNHLIQQSFSERNFNFVKDYNSTEISYLKNENCSIKFVIHGNVLIVILKIFNC